MHHIMRGTPDARRFQEQGTQDERSRVLRLIGQEKERQWSKRETARKKYVGSGDREADEDRILHECTHMTLGALENAVRQGHQRMPHV